MSTKTSRKPNRVSARKARQRRSRHGRSSARGVCVAIGAGVAILAALFYVSNRGGPGSGKYEFQVGNPGPGQAAPPMQLPSTAGGTFDLASQRGKTVMLYFQEGIMCQPCWDQLSDIETSFDKFRALGIDAVASITGDPLDALRQKVADEGLTTPLLSDRGVVVSKTYEANLFGMMGSGFNGHSFVVVGPDGMITWRADYGGPPHHYMYVPVATLLQHMRQGLEKV